MARAATTSDVFNAVAEPQRRRILTLLKGRECAVGDVANALGMRQPATSKHLQVLHEVGLVYFRQEGKRHMYGLNASGLEPIHQWTGGFEQYWNESFDRLNTYLRQLGAREN